MVDEPDVTWALEELIIRLYKLAPEKKFNPMLMLGVTWN
jgi:hypothetical protein